MNVPIETTFREKAANLVALEFSKVEADPTPENLANLKSAISYLFF